MRRCFGLFVILFYLGIPDAYAQASDSANRTLVRDDSAVAFKKNFPAAATKLMLANVLPFSVDYFIRREAFSFISLQTIAHNLRLSSWEWDRDPFLNNQFSHPYHGSFYFNAFRSEGYSFQQAAQATLAGCLVWEIAGENERPAINDLINTTLGGVTWGEITHRLAKRFTHNWRSGRRKNALDVLGIALDPLTGISMLASRKRQQAQQGVFDTTIRFELSAGRRQYNRAEDHERKETRGEWFTRMNLVYGAANTLVKIPFAYFSAMVELGTSDSTLFNIARIRGNLTGWTLRQTPLRSHTLLLQLNYDYYNNSAFAYGMQSLQGAFHSRFQLPKKSRLQLEGGPSLICLAAISDEDLFKGKKRDYDYASGAGLAGTANLYVLDRLGFRSSFYYGWLHTLDGKNANYHVLNAITALRGQLMKNVFVEYEWGHFRLKSLFRNAPKETKHNSYKRISAGCQFRI